MAMGMEMLLKSMGFDPDVVREQFESARQQVDAKVQQIESKLDRIELSQSRIEAQNQEILRCLELSEERAKELVLR